jgi:3-methyladenine DNA glycosylase AlkD
MARAKPPARFIESTSAPLDAQEAVDWLKRRGSKAGRDGMARYALPSDKAFGVAMRDVQALAKEMGRSHDLAEALKKTGWYEARTLASYVDDPACVTPAQMDRWCRAFDNWAICDTISFHLFDHTPYAWAKVSAWAVRREEFVKRAAFALLWAHRARQGRRRRAVRPGSALIERAANDDRPT